MVVSFISPNCKIVSFLENKISSGSSSVEVVEVLSSDFSGNDV